MLRLSALFCPARSGKADRLSAYVNALLPQDTGMLINAANRSADELTTAEREEPSYAFSGGVLGFVFYWLAFALPFVVYGTNTLLFMLYTWPFFLALLPVSVLVGILIHRLLSGRLLFSVPLCALLVVTLFWQTFSLLSGW
ncbi:hypothetical protein ETAE_0700 [Edwardsiella piscicida]|uniref:DUF3561 family protein n=3 Tax=Edwardsiella TaxID=635 RepID=A0AAU8P1Q1_EDWPI|nr:hypothetical protein ETAE_0700 [Edwardsiella tarda EIB202]ADM40766.1 Putative membrane protein [Edwardsiella tarda FL6-60]GBK55227.1 hypothetical protein JFPO13_contig000017-0103 [Edwardsiella piscicida]GBK59075.1 hypothetical protein JFPO14_contig00016-0102 [Edwardsiella piscicida]